MAEPRVTTYEQLSELERKFDRVELEMIKTQNLLTSDLYNQRQELVSSIDGFWALVFEQASSDIDTYIQAADSQVFAEALASIDVKRFEIPPYLPSGQEEGSPRSIKISFHFKPNKWFHDAVIEKYFWHRQGKNGWVGLVSEPVNIRWKQGMDLTEGLLDAAFRAYRAEVDAGVQWKVETDVKKSLPEQLSLMKKIETIPDGGKSFFNFFGFRGHRVSKEESAHVEKNGPDPEPEETSSEGDAVDDFDDENKEMPREIFPDGEDLAIAISEDLWTDALKYFTEAQNDSGEHEEDDEDEDDDEDDVDIPALVAAPAKSKSTKPNGNHSDDDRPRKKQKA